MEISQLTRGKHSYYSTSICERCRESYNQYLDGIVGENEKAILDYKSGNKVALNFLIGQVMKASNKRADFATAKKILEERLK